MVRSIRHIIGRVFIISLWLCILALFLFIAKSNWGERSRSITVFSWGGTFSPERVRAFEKKTGIKVYISSYVTNEELLVKLRATGARDYDLVIPSDYAMEKMIQEGLLQKIDMQKLDFIEELNPLLLGHFFDPQNEYSVPLEWGVYLIGFNKKILAPSLITPKNAWKFIFTPQFQNEKVVMVNDPLEAINFASLYLYGYQSTLSGDQISGVQDLLIAQNRWVRSYNSLRADYYLGTKSVAVAVASSLSIFRGIGQYKDIDFVVPDETFITIENCAIPVMSKKTDLVYEFLNFMYEKETVIKHFSENFFCPTRLDAINDLDVSDREKKIMRSSKEAFKHYHFVRTILPEQEKNSLWVSVKS